jgi:hypothetical protein
MDRRCNTHAGDDKCIHFMSERLKREDHLGDLDLDGMTILKLMLNRVLGCGLNLSVSRYGPVAGSCEHSNENSSYINA